MNAETIETTVAVLPMRLIVAPDVHTGRPQLYAEPYPECSEIYLRVKGLVEQSPSRPTLEVEIIAARYDDGVQVHPDAFEDWRWQIEQALIEAYKERMTA